MKYDDVSVLVGKVPTYISVDDPMIIHLDNGEKYKIEHDQSCCEQVYIDEVIGNVDDLIGVPLESVTEDHPDLPLKENADCDEWTVYTFTSAKDTLVVKWYGSSNGYYSTTPELTKLN